MAAVLRAFKAINGIKGINAAANNKPVKFKTMKKFYLIAIVTVSALTALSFTAGKGVTLRLRPQKDKVYVIKSKTTQINSMKIQGQSMSSTQTIETTQSMTAKEISDAKNVFETQIDALKINVSQMGMNMQYDSENPQNTSPMIAGQVGEFEKNIKKPVNITYDNLGHLEETSDFEMSQISNVIIELPEDEVSVGSEWTYTKTQEISDIEMTVTMKVTVTGINKKGVDVSFNGTVDSKDITGTYEGTSTINPQTGLVMSSNIKNKISMTITEQGMTIPLTVNGTTTISVEEK